jgi:hypothetical protein
MPSSGHGILKELEPTGNNEEVEGLLDMCAWLLERPGIELWVSRCKETSLA